MSKRSIALLIGMVAVGLISLWRFSRAEDTVTIVKKTAGPSDTVFNKEVLPFLKKHCYSCHDERKTRGGFRIDTLGTDFLKGKTPDVWREVIDRINLGEMPPKSQPRPDPKEAFKVVEWVGRGLKYAERSAHMAGGRILMRRLNRSEYAYTAGDLLQLDANLVEKVHELLPADGKAEGFDRVASALFFDQTQMEKYLAISDLIAQEAIQKEPPPTSKYVWEAEAYRRTRQMVPVYQGSKHKIPLGADYFKLRSGGFETWNGNRNSRNNTGFVIIPPGPSPNLTKVVNQDGYYRIRIHGGAFAGERGEPIKLLLTYARSTPIETKFVIQVKGTLEKPEVAESLVFLRAGQEGQKTSMQVNWNGLNDVRLRNPDLEKLSIQRLRYLGKRQKAVAAKKKEEATKYRKELDAVIAKLETFTGPEWIPNKKYDLAKVPRLFLDKIEVEGPIPKEWPPASHIVLGLKDSTPQTEASIREIFARLLPRAYRRPVQPEEIDRIVNIVQNGMTKHKLSFHEALRMGLQTVLCSPGFVFIQEPHKAETGSRPLNDYELASRLSYFLWSSMPDEKLLALASQKKLQEGATLREQVRRLLADPKSRRLVEGFAGQWLYVREFGSVMPANEYRDYDEELETASIEEPLAFFQHVLNKNLPITNFVDSDFLVINERLAKHYGIEGVEGPEFRPVKIGPEHHRGGVLGMAGLLTLLSDGTRTLPVRRAAWVLENMLNDPPPPPPPNAGDIQPNTKGKRLSVRQRLALHRKEPTCASCHAKLDSYGLALENYDAIGAWRTKQNGEGIRGPRAPKIDPSGALKSGRSFETLEGFKAALLAEKEKFARAFTEKLLTYALCRPVGYVDHKTVDQLTTRLADDDYRIQTLIQAIVASESFRSK